MPPRGGEQLFHFGGDLGLMALADGYTGTQYNIPAGDYTIWEDVPDGWALTDVTCSGTGSASCTPNSGTPGVTVHLATGDCTTVTFTNTRTCGDAECGDGESCDTCPEDCGPCPTCDDGIQNGDEEGIDCGGSSCPPCVLCHEVSTSESLCAVIDPCPPGFPDCPQ